jgi:hypothetical protein
VNALLCSLSELRADAASIENAEAPIDAVTATHMEDADADELDALAVRRVALEGPLHVTPVPELEGDLGRAAVDVEHLDGEPPREGRQERGHGGLERLLVRVEDAVLGGELGAQEVVVAADGHHLGPAQGLHPCRRVTGACHGLQPWMELEAPAAATGRRISPLVLAVYLAELTVFWSSGRTLWTSSISQVLSSRCTFSSRDPSGHT